MKILIPITMVSALLLTGKAEGAPLPKMQGEVITLKTPAGLRFGLWGTKVNYPAPTLLIFSATLENALGEPYFRQCGNALSAQGYLCVSVDLPGHGQDHQAGEPGGLATWRVRYDQGNDFITPFTTHVRKLLDHLIATGYADTERIAACGTSRGAFMALQLAAVEPRIRATAAFAPVTALATLREFHGAPNHRRLESLSILARAEQLAGRALWLMIGDRDERVGTDDTIAFARQVTAFSLAQSKPAEVTLLVKPEPKGHTTPTGAPQEAAQWIAAQLAKP